MCIFGVCIFRCEFFNVCSFTSVFSSQHFRHACRVLSIDGNFGYVFIGMHFQATIVGMHFK